MVLSGEKTALVTGGARGHGKAIAAELARSGATVYLADIARDLPEVPYALSSTEDLEAAVAELRAIHERIFPLILDVRQPDQVARAFAQVEKAQIESAHPGVDILVNNAGLLVLNPTEQVDDAEWRVHLETMLSGAFHCVRRALPGMNRRGWGRIINIASVAGHRAIGLGVAYTAAKHGLIGLTRALAMEVARQGITVNAICPGTTETAAVLGTGKALGLSREESLRQFTDKHLTGEPILPQDVAEAARWLASDKAARINGASLFVDDGWHVH